MPQHRAKRSSTPRGAAILGVSLIAMLAASVAQAQAQAAPILVTVTDKGCVPNTISAKAGKAVFKVKNASARVMEWEILKGVMVVEERENIIPGFEQTLSATLDAGEYAMTCGRLSNPRGILTVAATDAPAAKPELTDLIGPLAEYKVYVTGQVDTLAEETKRFTDAVKRNDLAAAKQAYAPARVHYERIEPMAELFDDLDKSMDSREDDFEKKAADPKFTGFHRMEKSLFADNSTAGLAPLADKLMGDVLELKKRLTTLTIKPKDMVGGAAALIEEVASKKISGEEDRYSRTDLWDFRANLDGAQKIVALLQPLVQKQNATLDARIKANFKKVDTVLAKYQAAGGGFESYEKLTPQDRAALKGPIAVLAEDLSKLRGTLGID